MFVSIIIYKIVELQFVFENATKLKLEEEDKIMLRVRIPLST